MERNKRFKPIKMKNNKIKCWKQKVNSREWNKNDTYGSAHTKHKEKKHTKELNSFYF